MGAYSKVPCPRCGAALERLEGEWGLIGGPDLPRFGSRTEIQITPRNVLRVGVARCPSPDCGYLELAAPAPREKETRA